MRKFLFVSLVGAVAEIGISPLRSISMNISCVGGFLFLLFLAFLLLYVYRKSGSPQAILWGLILGVCLVQIPVRIMHFHATLVSLPDFGCHLLGVLSGYFIWQVQGAARWAIVILSAGIVSFTAVKGYSYWLNKINFGTYSGYIKSAIPKSIEGYDDNGKYLHVSDFRGKVVVLDFWFTRCGFCFAEFPAVQTLYDKYKDNPEFKLFAVDEPIKSDTAGQAINTLRELKYTFPVLVLSNQELPKTLGINGYPAVIVVDKNQTMVFKGNIEQALPIINGLLKGS